MAILRKNRKYKTIYEANGFPSIELPFAYQNISPETLEKLYDMEKFCLENSDQIITPSHSIKEKVLSYGIADEKVTVIPNGAEIPQKTEKPTDAPPRYIIYFGAVQAWQGVDVLLKAFARLGRFERSASCNLFVKSFAAFKMLRKLAEKLEINEQNHLAFRFERRRTRAVACTRRTFGRAFDGMFEKHRTRLCASENSRINGGGRSGHRFEFAFRQRNYDR